MIDQLIQEAHELVLKCSDLSDLNTSKYAALEVLNAASLELDNARERLDKLTDFMRGKLSGQASYELPRFVAEWLDKSIQEEENFAFPALAYVHVLEHGGQTWAATSDGFRLHAYAVQGIPTGLYQLEGWYLMGAPEHLKPKEIFSVVDPAMSLYDLPVPSTGNRKSVGFFNEEIDSEVMAWKVEGDHIVGCTLEESDYHIYAPYWPDALSIYPDQLPQLVAVEGMKFNSRLQMRWGNQALAVIMPMDLRDWRNRK